MMTLRPLSVGISLAIFVSLFWHTAAFADETETDKAPKECVAPVNTPIIPDGNVASKDELLAAQDAIKNFQQLNLDFLDCIAEKRSKLDPEAAGTAEQIASLDAAGDAAVAREEAVAAEFNAARKIYMDR